LEFENSNSRSIRKFWDKNESWVGKIIELISSLFGDLGLEGLWALASSCEVGYLLVSYVLPRIEEEEQLGLSLHILSPWLIRWWV
jgi:hypothetical protein